MMTLRQRTETAMEAITVISLYDYTGEAVRPWAEAGYTCYCYDIQHPEEGVEEAVGGAGGRILYLKADLLFDSPDWDLLVERHRNHKVAMVFSWPMCTDLAVSGTRHWEAKRKVDPEFQIKAAANAEKSAWFADQLGSRYMVENPIGVLVNIWRQWDYKFNPCDFGGYLDGSPHPRWPEFIPPMDAYTKMTCLWTGNGYVFPEKRPVAPEQPVERFGKNGKVYRGSRQWAMLGGKSLKTKNIRSATPRGFALANFIANGLLNVKDEGVRQECVTMLITQ